MYQIKQWRNRNTEFKGRRRLIDTSTGVSQVVDVSREEGTIYDEGDAFNAANMNDQEARIYAGFEDVSDEVDQAISEFKTELNSTVAAIRQEVLVPSTTFSVATSSLSMAM